MAQELRLTAILRYSAMFGTNNGGLAHHLQAPPGPSVATLLALNADPPRHSATISLLEAQELRSTALI